MRELHDVDQKRERDFDRRKPDERESWKKDSNRDDERRDDDGRYKVRETRREIIDDDKDNDKYQKSSSNRRFEQRGGTDREEKDYVRIELFYCVSGDTNDC